MKSLDVMGAELKTDATGNTAYVFRNEAFLPFIRTSQRPNLRQHNNLIRMIFLNSSFRVSSVIRSSVESMLRDIVEEGNRLNDYSMKNFSVHGYRPGDEREGILFWNTCRKVRREFFSDIVLDSECERLAKDDWSDTSLENQFISALHIANRNIAISRLIDFLTRVRRTKAPRGRSTHQTGRTIDINFYIWQPSLNNNDGSFVLHDENSSKLPMARKMAITHFLTRYAAEYGFGFYNPGDRTSAEAWHLEFISR